MCWRLIDNLFLCFINSIAFMRKIRIVSVKIQFFLVASVFLNFLVTNRHWLKFEFPTIFENETVLWFLKVEWVSVRKEKDFVWNSSGNFLSLLNVKTYAKGVVLRGLGWFCTTWDKRSLQVTSFPYFFPFIIMRRILKSSKFLHI